ncbi:thioesterase [Treponema sp.]
MDQEVPESAEELFTVRTWDVDRTDKLSLSAVFNYFQELAGYHATALGMGTEVFKNLGQAWILSRMSALLEKRPGRGTKLLVRTWPRGTDTIFAIRDYELKDSVGNLVARGRSAWIILDTVKLRPLRPEKHSQNIPLNEGLDALPDGAKALSEQKGLRKTGERIAAYSDIDYNDHVNNARYIQWIQDALPAAALENAQQVRLDINYLSELKEGDGASLWTGNSEEGLYFVEGKNTASLKPTFRAELRILS